MAGKVYLVGAGPGDPDLLTIKAWKIIKKSDIILYDRLVDSSIIRKMPKKIKKISVGKKIGEDSDVQQERINELIEKYYNKGKIVVRLKGGDPFLFGRGGEEAEFMKMKKIDFDVIPGITSAIGVPTHAKLPLTHRNYSSSIHIIPGHLKKGHELNWEMISKLEGTLVILMGASKLEEIMNNLMKNGKSEETPVCIIQNGTTKKEKILKGNIKNISEIAKEVKAPVVIIVGKVVKLLD
ncbi:MAG: uroporphyrinogen-III C-methyltransferase [Thermoplasmata archaeon]|nr:uroporphyrinogen-III C-methyltransferase [Thermoplasmata archaeon]